MGDRSAGAHPVYVGERLRDALVHDPRVGELDLQVRIAGERVFVTGTVTTDERRAAVSSIVGELVPELELCNEVTVSTGGPDDTERLT